MLSTASYTRKESKANEQKRGIFMRKLSLASVRFSVATVAALCLSATALAEDVVLLPNGLMSPTSKEQTKPNQFKKAPPWRIGVSFGGVGNTWIVQMIQEMKHEASLHKEVGEFIFVEANWQAAKQVADVEDLLTKKVDVLILGPISAGIGAPLSEKAVKAGIPVVVFGAFGKAMQSTVEVGAGGEVFGKQGATFCARNSKARAASGPSAASPVRTKKRCATTVSASHWSVRTSRSRKRFSAIGVMPKPSNCARTWCSRAMRSTASGFPAPR